MWSLQNQTPYAAERTWTRDKNGIHHWIVAVKATYHVNERGIVRLSDEQQPLLHLPEHHGEAGLSSLKYEADLVPVKTSTDVLLNGHAYAPHGKPARSVEVSLRVGAISKQLVVHGMRVYSRRLLGVALSAPVEFTKRQLIYEWAYGGADLSDPDVRNHVMDKRNPVGKGVALRAQNLLDQPGHSIEYPKGDPAQMGPAGFAPISSYWSPRLELMGTYDQHWEQTRKPLLPSNYDERHVLCAPADQRPPKHLRGGERVELIHLSPTGLLRFELPSPLLQFETVFGSRSYEHDGKLATVIIEPDIGRLMMVWQTSLAVRITDADYLDYTLIKERKALQ